MAPFSKEHGMGDEPQSNYRVLDPANDGDLTRTHVDDVVLTLARLLGRQIARDEFDRLKLAPPVPSLEDQPP
jgi:hypothetical protein